MSPLEVGGRDSYRVVGPVSTAAEEGRDWCVLQCLPWCLPWPEIACLGLVHGLHDTWWILPKNFSVDVKGMQWSEIRDRWNLRCSRSLHILRDIVLRLRDGVLGFSVLMGQETSCFLFLRVCHTQNLPLGNTVPGEDRQPHSSSVSLGAGYLHHLALCSDIMAPTSVISEDTFFWKKKIQSSINFLKILF